MNQTLAFLPNIGFQEMLVIAVIMLLLFGRRLPEVGRSLGKGIVEFKKGLKDVEDEVRRSSDDRQYESASRPPLTSGEDRRVSRADAPEVARPTPQPAAEPHSGA
jgi:sec-independent protein translocase protein TatA